MINENTICSVKNRSASSIVYRVPELGIRREFAIGETKKISYDELVKLSYQPGGRELMANFLQVQNSEAISDLGIHTEPEYNYNEAEIINLLKNGSLDEFLDCLDFAPVGVQDLVKKLAVSLPLEDYSKRQALKEKTGFNVDDAIKNIEAEKAEDKAAGAKIEQPTGRRVQPVAATAESEAPARRAPQYKVISKTE